MTLFLVSRVMIVLMVDQDDFIYGQEGNDLIYASGGNDLLSGGDGIDTASFELLSSRIRADLRFW